jgi:hypothetical protein
VTRFDGASQLRYGERRLAGGLKKLRKALNSDGMIWISWPKKAAGEKQ